MMSYDDLNALCDEDLSEINSVAGIFYSNPDLAKRKTFTIPWGRQKMGHFVFFLRLIVKNHGPKFLIHIMTISRIASIFRVFSARVFSVFLSRQKRTVSLREKVELDRSETSTTKKLNSHNRATSVVYSPVST